MTCINLENAMLNETPDSKSTYCSIPFMLSVQSKQIHGSVLVVAYGCRQKEWEVMGVGFSFWGHKHLLDWAVVMVGAY